MIRWRYFQTSRLFNHPAITRSYNNTEKKRKQKHTQRGNVESSKSTWVALKVQNKVTNHLFQWGAVKRKPLWHKIFSKRALFQNLSVENITYLQVTLLKILSFRRGSSFLFEILRIIRRIRLRKHLRERKEKIVISLPSGWFEDQKSVGSF